MKKLEDFETSLLDEYDVGCLDTLLQVRWLVPSVCEIESVFLTALPVAICSN